MTINNLFAGVDHTVHEKEVLHQFLDHYSDFGPLPPQGGELFCQAPFHPRSQFQQPVRHPGCAGSLHYRRRRVVLQQVEHGRVVQVWVHNAL